LQIIDDDATLSEIVQKLTETFEKSKPKPWSFDGTTKFAERLLSQIIGFRIEIERIEGKWKMSQNQPIERREKVVAALRKKGDPHSIAVAEIMDVSK
jgi:transcriptional regulator